MKPKFKTGQYVRCYAGERCYIMQVYREDKTRWCYVVINGVDGIHYTCEESELSRLP